MSSLAATEFKQHLVFPGTPPELVSPSAQSYASISTSSEAQTVVSGTTITTTMSIHDKSSANEVSPVMKRDGSTHSRPSSSAATATARQQLPSLSSLFGPPGNRSLNSPVSERPGSYSASSPLDRPRIASGDRTVSGSYFAQHATASMAQPRSTLDTKLDMSERPSLHPLKRTFSGSSSPGYRDLSSARSEPRLDGESVSKWPVQHESRNQEYTFGSRDHLFRPSQDQFRLHFPGSRETHGAAYGDQRPGHPNPPPTPTSTITSEGMSKDGLGPKIWTGSHFLPRFVRAADVPGEGLCFFYDDGSHCKTVIDGEAVNAHWGVTKAGKPRKRLAIACMTCREKKIKCDPDFPRCVQCEKFGRICKFKNAPRGGHNGSPTTPPAELDDMRKLGSQGRSGDYRIGESESGSPISPRAPLPQSSPEESSHKRLKLEGSRYQMTGETYGHRSGPLEHGKPEHAGQHRTRELPRIPDHVLSRAWQTDPYVSDPQSIIAVVSHFFAQVDNTMILRLLPQDATMAWVSSSAHRKTPEDLMLLYSMLAVGVALSDGPRHIAFEYAQVAHYAQKMLQLDCLQLAQSRIILALYYISTYRLRDASDLIAAAAAAAASLQLHLEMDESIEAKRPTFPLNLTKAGFAESRRRTMWSLFMLERLSGMFPQQPAIINAEDMCIRLPVENRAFEKQMDETVPLFDPFESAGHSLDSTGYLVEMVHLWSSCQSAVFRQIRRAAWSETESSRLHGLLGRLERWRDQLPDALSFGAKNLESSILTGKAGTFLSMHLLYRHAIIALTRYGRNPSQMSRHERMVAVYQCRDNSKIILDILQAMSPVHRGGPLAWNPMPPTTAFIVSEAVDILSCGGSLASLDAVIKAIDQARPALATMGMVWENQRATVSMMDDRLARLRRVSERDSDQPSNPGAGYRIIRSSPGPTCNGVVWQLDDGLRTPSRDLDVIFFSLH